MKTHLLFIGLLALLFQPSAAQKRPFALDPQLRPGEYEPHTVVVKYRPAASRNGRVAAPSAGNNAVLKQLAATRMAPLFPNQKPRSARNGRLAAGNGPPVDLSTVYQLTLPAGRSLESAINLLLSDSNVVYAEPLYTGFRPLHVPNDPLAHPVTGQQYALRNIRAYEAWDVHRGSPGVTVGVVDYGFEMAHDELKHKVQYNTADPVDGLDNDKDGYVDNYAGWNIISNNTNLLTNAHGTRVAGCAVGHADNGIGGAGVGGDCRFMAVSAYNPATRQFSGFAGLVYLAEKGCSVINLSWGRPGPSSFLEQEVINYAALNYDVLITASAGNEGGDVSRYWWPASYDNVLSVAATNSADLKWGTKDGSAYNDKVDISAPGQDILSPENGNGYTYDSGTSYSSPIVAGAAALVRSLFPALSAAETARRLVATADDIYQLPGNAAFAGKLGSGRLNVYRALTETTPKAVVPAGTTLQNALGQPYLMPGTPNTLVAAFRNAGVALDNARITLAANTPLVAIENATVALGAVAAGATAANTATPFRLQVSPQMPARGQVVFTLTLTDGAYQRQYSWTEFANPDYLDVAVNAVSLTATSNGRLGYADAYSFWNANIAANQQRLGNGIRFGGQPLLFEAGLVLAAGGRVSDCVRNEAPEYARNQHFEPVRPVALQHDPLTDVLAGGLLREDWYHPGRIGVDIQHHTYAWRDAPNRQFVIVEYKISNRSDARLDSLYTGLFADWEIGGRRGNQADWDAARKLGYVYNPAGSHPYAGVQLLTEQPARYYAFDSQDGINIFDGFTAAEKFQALDGPGRTRTAAGTDDVAHLLAAQVRNLGPGDSAVVAFAVLAAADLPGLQLAADSARRKFVSINRSAKPVVPAVQTCRGGRVMITPAPGRTFRFYQKQADGTLQPLGAGREMALDNIVADTTIFVTNADSLYESEPVPAKVRVFGTRFTLNKDSLGIADKDVLQLTDQTSGAVRWRWHFGDGHTSTEPRPAHTYREAGEYAVTLVTENEQGCRDTLVRTVRVFPGILSPVPVVQPVTICAGDSVLIQPSNARVFGFYNQDKKLIGAGSRYRAGRIYRDTTFYVTATDYIVESQPVVVQIRVSPIKAGFTAADTVVLALGGLYAPVDTSTGGVQRRWRFGDGAADTARAPAHRYAAEGTYRVWLNAYNAAGCADSAWRRVVVVCNTGQLKAGFTAADTVDLAFNETYAPVDTSTGGVRRLWRFGDGATDTARTPRHRYAAEGVYRVLLKAYHAQGCQDSVSRMVVVVRTTGELAEGMQLAPTATADFVTVTRRSGLRIKEVGLRVYSATGVEVFRHEGLPAQMVLDFRPLGRGLYVARFTGGGQQITRRIVVQ